MSQPETSQSRLSYSRDLLLKYQHIYKPDPVIDALLRPFIVQSDNQSTLILRSQGSPSYAKFDASARFKNIPKTTPVPRRKPPNEGQGKYEKKSGAAHGPIYKPRQIPKDLSASQKENIEHQPPSSSNPNIDLTDPATPNHDLTKSQKIETTNPQNHHNRHPYLVGMKGVSQSMQALRVGPNSVDREIGKINSVFFYDSKFGSIFAPSVTSVTEVTNPNNNDNREVTKFDCGVGVPSPQDMEKLLTSYNLIENPLSPIIPLVTDISVTATPQPPAVTATPVTATTTSEIKPLHDQNHILLPGTGIPEPLWSNPPHPGVEGFLTPTKNRSPNPKKNGTPKKNVTPSYQPLTPPNNKSPFRNQAVSPSGRPISPLDEQRLLQRQKQIDYGYRTVGYLRYRLLVPKDKRKPDHPRTPKKRQGCSKRSWDGQLKKWRRDLHLWDPDNIEAFKALLNSPIVETIVAANPELADIVKTVREKLDNPNALLDNESDSENEGITPTSPISPDILVQKGKSEIKSVESSKKNDSRLEKVARTLVF